MLWGNFYYVYMARKLAYKEKRDDICAMPYGINTPGACNSIRFCLLLFIFLNIISCICIWNYISCLL